MPFVIISEHESGQTRYEKVGRLRPGENGIIEVIRDGHGVIRSVRVKEVVLALNDLLVDGLKASESGNRLVISGDDGGEYWVLTKQVRGMIRDWPKKKAALFQVFMYGSSGLEEPNQKDYSFKTQY